MKTIWLWGTGAALIAGCASTGEIAVRPASHGAPAAQMATGSDAAAQAAGDVQLALGNVALAIEAYRRELRAAPTSVAALRGLAQAYDRMGRFDLSRRYYEQALAVAPGQAALYEALAGSLAVQGRAEEAAAVRREGLARQRGLATAPAAPPSGERVAVANVAPPAPPIESPTARRPAAQAVAESAPTPEPAAPGPRLARLSASEVALVTRPGPRWTARTVEATPRRTTIRFDRAASPTRLVLLNAARVARLAAGTRAYLAQRGFATAAIGDSDRVRGHSVVVYGPGLRGPAQRIAAQFGFAVRPLAASAPGAADLTLMLGRDAARDRALGAERRRVAG